MTLEITDLATLQALVQAWRAAGDGIALVPTMGALHEGHLALVARAKEHADRVIVSIFVNPTQFGPTEDFAQYPRTLAQDLDALDIAGADAVWLPSVETMYPNGPATDRHVAGHVSETLEGAVRPGHFDGVATVVARLFDQVQPDLALFGEKDYQQLLLIKRLVKQDDIPVRIVAGATEREPDGLARSSRNRYLDEKQRRIAVKLNQVLRHSAYALTQEKRDVADTLRKAKQLLLDGGFSKVDYVALCDAATLAPLSSLQTPARLLAAVHVGSTRLIDNIAVE